MLRKALTVSIAALFLTSSALIASPANAASVKGGQSCTKVNSKKLVKYAGETYIYKCVKNPLYKKTKLTWTLEECLVAIASYKASRDELSKELRDLSCAPGV